MTDTRACERCGKAYTRRPDCSRKQFTETRFCSRTCRNFYASHKRTENVRRDRIEDIEWILDSDSPENVARRLGYKNAGVLIRMCERWDRPDLAARLYRRMEGSAA